MLPAKEDLYKAPGVGRNTEEKGTQSCPQTLGFLRLLVECGICVINFYRKFLTPIIKKRRCV